MELKTGSRLRSAVCSTEIMIVRGPSRPVTLTCGGTPMVALDDDPSGGTGSPVPEWADGTALGKRYALDELGIEVLCTKGGDGTLAVDGVALSMEGAKPLPASD